MSQLYGKKSAKFCIKYQFRCSLELCLVKIYTWVDAWKSYSHLYLEMYIVERNAILNNCVLCKFTQKCKANVCWRYRFQFEIYQQNVEAYMDILPFILADRRKREYIFKVYWYMQ